MAAVKTTPDPPNDSTAGTLERLVTRFDPTVFNLGRSRARLRIESDRPRDVVIEDGTARLTTARGNADAVLTAKHMELDCGHVPQLERPRQTHDAIKKFLAAGGS